MLPPDFLIGHWSDPVAATGCTVILCPLSTVGGVDVRGNSPGSRELALLGSEKSMTEVHGVLLTGGSAFGLAAAEGVVRYLEEKGVGYKTPWARVPIVPAAVVFDLNIGSSTVRPTAENGYAACLVATHSPVDEGSVGAGTGATVGKWSGPGGWMKGGVGVSSVREGELVVSAIAVVNAVGDVLDDAGGILAGARTPEGKWAAGQDPLRRFRLVRPLSPSIGNTTLVAVLANALVSKVDANRIAQRGHDGMARAIRPAHTMYDGDVVFALCSGTMSYSVDLLAEMGAAATEGAIRSAVLKAEGIHNVPSVSGRGR